MRRLSNRLYRYSLSRLRLSVQTVCLAVQSACRFKGENRADTRYNAKRKTRPYPSVVLTDVRIRGASTVQYDTIQTNVALVFE